MHLWVETIKRWAKLALSLAFFGAAKIAGFLGLNRKPRLVILYYHSVRAKNRAAFARQLDAVQFGADAVVPADFCGPAEPGQLLVAITFDDAFASIVENALPELAARNMPSTIFAPSGVLARAPGWAMEEKYVEDRDETVATPEMLRAAASSLVVIGAHSLTHVSLSRVGRDAAIAEITGSREQLERLLDRDVSLFAFPFGDYNDELIDLCRVARFRYVFTNTPRIIDPTADTFVRGRVSISFDDGPLEFWLKMRGAYCWMSWYSNLKSWFPRGGDATPNELTTLQKPL